jgi:hypothetical protein
LPTNTTLRRSFGFDEAFANCGYENIGRWSEADTR